MSKLISVIVPSYNMESYLPKCLGSMVVAPELMDRLEVLVVNDGSKDRTSEVAHEFAAKWPATFKVIDKANGNYGSCVNVAVDAASGAFVKVVDADDSVSTGGLESLLGLVQNVEDDVDLVVSDYCTVNPDGGVRKKIAFRLDRERPFGILDLPTRMEIQSLAYRRSILQNVNYRQTEGISYTDLEWITYPMAGVRKVRYLPIVVTRYLIGRDGQTVTPATYAKNGWMPMQINKRMIEYYAAGLPHCVDEKSRTYVKNLIKMHVRTIYMVRTFRFGCLVTGSLLEYDSWFKETAPDLYEEMNNVVAESKHFRFHYIREWRRRKSAKTIKFFLFKCYVATTRGIRKLRAKL